LAAIYDGASRTEAARTGGVTLQIVRDWVLRFNAAVPAGLVDCNDRLRETETALTFSVRLYDILDG
jgi:hypothetical protein